MADPAAVDEDALCIGLVREYLYRKGFVHVLKKLDEETVRTDERMGCPRSGTCASYKLSQCLR